MRSYRRARTNSGSFTFPRLRPITLGFALILGLMSAAGADNKRYGPGVSDTEIKIGQTMPYSGPLSVYGTNIGPTEQAYFRVLNTEGGIHGRKVTLISVDDAYSPAKALEQMRRLVEEDHVLALMGMIGTSPNLATRKYLNQARVPQLFILSGADVFNRPKEYPWTVPLATTDRFEGRTFAKFILATRPKAKIAVLYQDDDLGREYLGGLREGLGERAAAAIVATASYQPTDPTVDSQIIALREAGADTLFEFAIGKFVAQAIRKSYELGWHPLQIIPVTGASIEAAFRPAGLEKAVGVVTAGPFRDPSEPGIAADPQVKAWLDFMSHDYPQGDPTNGFTLAGYSLGMVTAEVLRRSGDDLTRENLLRVVTHIHDYRFPLLVPGASVTYAPDDYQAIRHVEFRRFDGKGWQPIGAIPNLKP